VCGEDDLLVALSFQEYLNLKSQTTAESLDACIEIGGTKNWLLAHAFFYPAYQILLSRHLVDLLCLK
jgi:hypothetical protein